MYFLCHFPSRMVVGHETCFLQGCSPSTEGKYVDRSAFRREKRNRANPAPGTFVPSGEPFTGGWTSSRLLKGACFLEKF